jgi:DHA1 family multidrug resistance protein-like MFS transporter
MAAASLLRSITGCVLPIFAESLFRSLGYGWGGTLLALVSLVSLPLHEDEDVLMRMIQPALPAPLVLFLYGKQLRERFKFEP